MLLEVGVAVPLAMIGDSVSQTECPPKSQVLVLEDGYLGARPPWLVDGCPRPVSSCGLPAACVSVS